MSDVEIKIKESFTMNFFCISFDFHSFRCCNPWAHKFSNGLRSHPQFLGARRVTGSKFHTENIQTLDTTANI
jgi:hypothetical protein